MTPNFDFDLNLTDVDVGNSDIDGNETLDTNNPSSVPTPIPSGTDSGLIDVSEGTSSEGETEIVDSQNVGVRNLLDRSGTRTAPGLETFGFEKFGSDDERDWIHEDQQGREKERERERGRGRDYKQEHEKPYENVNGHLNNGLERREREQLQKVLEDTEKMVFVAISAIDAYNILYEIKTTMDLEANTNYNYNLESGNGDVNRNVNRDINGPFDFPYDADGGKLVQPPNPEFTKAGNKLWNMTMSLGRLKHAAISPACSRGTPQTPAPSSINADLYSDIYVTFPQSNPTQAPTARSNVNSNRGSYSDNAPGSFTIFKFMLFGLLIASPCLRAIHLWWSGGGRIRLRHSEDNEGNGNGRRVTGLQYIPPMENWFGATSDAREELPSARLTHEQIMSLPEIIYQKPVHYDDVDVDDTRNSAISSGNGKKSIETIEEQDSNHVYNEDDDRSEASGSNLSTPADIVRSKGSNTTTITANSNTTSDDQSIHGEMIGTDDPSLASETSFENEAPTPLQLPTSPQRVLSITQASNSATSGANNAPQTTVPKEELSHDEERPEELQLPELPPTSRPLSFRTQRRLRSFTTTTCTTCSICIDEFEEGEKIRLLPLCGHAFHTECIMPWLQDRQGCCPLCKTPVLDTCVNISNHGEEEASSVNAVASPDSPGVLSGAY